LRNNWRYRRRTGRIEKQPKAWKNNQKHQTQNSKNHRLSTFVKAEKGRGLLITPISQTTEEGKKVVVKLETLPIKHFLSFTAEINCEAFFLSLSPPKEF
jgi:hypothetical protein